MYDIKSRRLELGKTLEEVGDIVGVGRSTVRKWEQGMIDNMKRDKIALLAKALQISPLELIYDDYSDDNLNISTIYSQLETPRKKKVYYFAEHQLEEQNRTIKVYGQTAAGEPIEYGQEIIEEKEVTYVPKGAEVALVINGDSMEPEFPDGSIVFYKRQPQVENGQIAIVEVNDGVTCKRIKFDYENEKVILQSSNDEYEDQVFEDDDVKVLGLVVQ